MRLGAAAIRRQYCLCRTGAPTMIGAAASKNDHASFERADQRAA